jgi:hypothetical protein
MNDTQIARPGEDVKMMSKEDWRREAKTGAPLNLALASSGPNFRALSTKGKPNRPPPSHLHALYCTSQKC